MKRLGALLLGILAVATAVFVMHVATTVDVPAKTEQVRMALEQTTTAAEFIRIAEGHGFKCSTSNAATQTSVRCWWFEPERLYDVIAWFQLVYGAIRANGTFVDGRKSGGYEIDDVYTGP